MRENERLTWWRRGARARHLPSTSRLRCTSSAADDFVLLPPPPPLAPAGRCVTRRIKYRRRPGRRRRRRRPLPPGLTPALFADIDRLSLFSLRRESGCLSAQEEEVGGRLQIVFVCEVEEIRAYRSRRRKRTIRTVGAVRADVTLISSTSSRSLFLLVYCLLQRRASSRTIE